jgi:hypothetical protein
MPRVGLISDTHGHLDPQVLGHFAGVDHIVHAGDIGWPSVLLELEALAPVTAVSGNTDTHPTWRETELVHLDDRLLLVHHIVEPRRLKPDLQRRILRERPDVVVFGHTHATFCEVIEGVMYVNPGSAGRARFGQPRTVAVLQWETGATELDVEFIELGR